MLTLIFLRSGRNGEETTRTWHIRNPAYLDSALSKPLRHLSDHMMMLTTQ